MKRKTWKGLRQGDPISPCLFLMVMEALSWLLEKAKEIGVFKGIDMLDNNIVISHLFYADDALILGEWSRENIQSIARVLRIFYLCSGLSINLHKSNLFGVLSQLPKKKGSSLALCVVNQNIHGENL